MQTEAVNQLPPRSMMNSGSQQFGRPSFGSWTLYGLGSESANLPGFRSGSLAPGNERRREHYGNGSCRTIYGGIPFRSSGDPSCTCRSPREMPDTQRAFAYTLNKLNDLAKTAAGDPEIAARIQSYEMAYRLQTSAPELMDLSQEPSRRWNRYGIKSPKDANFARNCPARPGG